MTDHVDARNQATFGAKDVVRHYARASELQPAEKTIFARHAEELASAALLDVGVGAGRTTAYLGPRVRRYVGVDYSAPMVEAARRRFPDRSLDVADARQLPFANASFDVVLFSHNGIDYVDAAGRDAVLFEAHRVLEEGGLFVFSTHNLLRPDLVLDRPGAGLVARVRAWRMRRANPDHRSWRGADFALVNDGAFAYRALTYHVRPSAQLATLAALGFTEMRLYAGTSGHEVAEGRADTLADPWFYVTCRRGAAR